MTNEQKIAGLEKRIADLRRMDEDGFHGFMTTVRLDTIMRLQQEIRELRKSSEH